VAKTLDQIQAEMVDFKVQMVADLWVPLTDEDKRGVVVQTLVKLLMGEAEPKVAKKIFELARADGLDALTDDDVDEIVAHYEELV
jgi:hypothetical protein